MILHSSQKVTCKTNQSRTCYCAAPLIRSTCRTPGLYIYFFSLDILYEQNDEVTGGRNYIKSECFKKIFYLFFIFFCISWSSSTDGFSSVVITWPKYLITWQQAYIWSLLSCDQTSTPTVGHMMTTEYLHQLRKSWDAAESRSKASKWTWSWDFFCQTTISKVKMNSDTQQSLLNQYLVWINCFITVSNCTLDLLIYTKSVLPTITHNQYSSTLQQQYASLTLR